MIVDTLMVTLAWADPATFVAVSVYVAVEVGLTVVLFPATVPTPLSMLNLVAFETFQVSVTAFPGATFERDATNELIFTGSTWLQVPEEQ